MLAHKVTWAGLVSLAHAGGVNRPTPPSLKLKILRIDSLHKKLFALLIISSKPIYKYSY